MMLNTKMVYLLPIQILCALILFETGKYTMETANTLR